MDASPFSLPATDTEIGPLTDGATVNQATTGTQLSVRADTSPATVGSVLFTLDGVLVRTENSPAYAIAGDDGAGDFNPLTPALSNGAHTLIVTPFSGANGTGKLGISKDVEGGTGRGKSDSRLSHLLKPKVSVPTGRVATSSTRAPAERTVISPRI